jgi:hypothetical protein
MYIPTQRDFTIRDPVLTDKGRAQCRALSASFKHHDSINLVVTSPLRRTIQTAALSFGPVLARDVPFLAIPEAQEVGDHASDTGLPPKELKAELAQLFAKDQLEFDIKKLNLDAVTEGWTSKVCAVALVYRLWSLTVAYRLDIGHGRGKPFQSEQLISGAGCSSALKRMYVVVACMHALLPGLLKLTHT